MRRRRGELRGDSSEIESRGAWHSDEMLSAAPRLATLRPRRMVWPRIRAHGLLRRNPGVDRLNGRLSVAVDEDHVVPPCAWARPGFAVGREARVAASDRNRVCILFSWSRRARRVRAGGFKGRATRRARPDSQRRRDRAATSPISMGGPSTLMRRGRTRSANPAHEASHRTLASRAHAARRMQSRAHDEISR